MVFVYTSNVPEEDERPLHKVATATDEQELWLVSLIPLSLQGNTLSHVDRLGGLYFEDCRS